MLRLRDRLRPQGDEGFTLLEAVVALSISAIIFTALSAATLSSLKAVLVGRTVQQSADVAQQAMEQLRSLGYDGATMKDSDIGVNDPLAMTTTSYYDPINDEVSSSGQPNAEPLSHDPAGLVDPHVSTVTPSASSSYTVRRYVTIPQDSTEANGTEYKRLTVVVSWTVRGETRERIQSALITSKRSGLPLPDYKFASFGLNYACVNPGSTGVLGFSLTNNGARDSWTISSSGGSQAWNYYLDDGSGAYESATDTTALSASVVGPVETTETKTFWAVTSTQPSTAAGTTSITFKATSVAQPSYSTSLVDTFQVTEPDEPCAGAPIPTATPTSSESPTPTPTPTVTPTPPPTPTTCAPGTVPSAVSKNGATLTNYYLPNGTTNVTNTAAISPLTLRKTPVPTSTTLWNYSTDLSTNTAGRRVNLTGTTTATTAEWRYQFGTASELSGTGTVALWGAPASGVASTSMGYSVTVQKISTAGVASTIGTAVTYPAAAWSCAGFKKFGVSVNFGQNPNTTKFTALESISVQVKALGADSLLAYDTTTFNAAVVLPVRNGG